VVDVVSVDETEVEEEEEEELELELELVALEEVDVIVGYGGIHVGSAGLHQVTFAMLMKLPPYV